MLAAEAAAAAVAEAAVAAEVDEWDEASLEAACLWNMSCWMSSASRTVMGASVSVSVSESSVKQAAVGRSVRSKPFYCTRSLSLYTSLPLLLPLNS